VSYYFDVKCLVCLLTLAGCAQHVGTRPYPKPKVADVVNRLAKQRNALVGFKTTASTMDYFINKQRAKGDVMAMAKLGRFVHVLALSPAGGQPVLDMVCDRSNFTLIDYQHNCSLTGPCDKAAIARFFGIELEPDDLVHLALGAPPVIANPTGTVTWDGNCGCERVVLKGAAGTEKLTIDARDGRWDVLDAELDAADGTVLWCVEDKDFVEVDKHRVPGKQLFKSPANSQDIVVEWGDPAKRQVNLQLDASKFQLQVPAGLATCP
jgi:hypothetical protein